MLILACDLKFKINLWAAFAHVRQQHSEDYMFSKISISYSYKMKDQFFLMLLIYPCML